MNTHFVLAEFDIYCKWESLPPAYRLYVNDELFTERDWIWPSNYNLTQMLQIQAAPGEYKVRLETVGTRPAVFTTNNYVVIDGNANWINNSTIRILDETN
jgi:hypothetical protein